MALDSIDTREHASHERDLKREALKARFKSEASSEADAAAVLRACFGL